MSVNIEDILLLKAQQDAANKNNNLGLALGTAGGAVAGAMKKGGVGSRMAGGLVGAILGGALGAGTSELMQRESPAARLLAKLQAQGGLSPIEARELEDVLTQTYNSITR